MIALELTCYLQSSLNSLYFRFEFVMSQDIVLYDILEKTFALFLGNKQFGKNCTKLVSLLNERNGEIREKCNVSGTILDHLVSGTKSLLRSFDTLKDSPQTLYAKDCNNDGDSNGETSRPGAGNTSRDAEDKVEYRDKAEQARDSKVHSERLPKDAKLQKELQKIKDADTFKEAMSKFRKINERAVTILEDNETDLNLMETAAQLSVISEILGNLTNLTDAMNNCKKYNLRLHQTLNVHDKRVNFAMYTLFCFMADFTGKPVAMLDWPMISGREVEKYHPILGELPTNDCEQPDPFTYIAGTGTGTEKVRIESCISAINCTGDIFAKDKVSSEIIKVTAKYSKWYSFTSEDQGREIVSISIDCSDCKTFTKCGETLSEPSEASSNLFGPACRGKMYILARSELNSVFRYYLCALELNGGKKVHEEELGFLERSAAESPKVKMFSINDNRIVILDVSRRVIHVCDGEGMEKNTLDVTPSMRNVITSRPPLITYDNGMICTESKFSNFSSKINVYDIITNEDDSCLRKRNPSEIKVERAVQAVAFDQESNKIVLLCYTVFLQYYLAIYEGGQLIQDIK